MNTDFLVPVLYSTIAGSATILGFLLVYFAKNWVKRYSFVTVSLAAGVLLGTTFFHLLPEVNEILEGGTFQWVLLGFVIFFLIEAVVGFHACKEEDDPHNHEHILGSVAGIGIFFHSLLDGVAIAVGHEISPTLGLITTLAVMFHELPEGIFTFSILIHGKMPIKKAVWWTLLVALATPVGAILALILAPNLSEHTLGILLALAAGSFLYISASDLVPESHKPRSLKISLFLIVGLALMYFLSR